MNDEPDESLADFEAPDIAADFEHYLQREKELEEMLNLPPDASLLDQACQLYECAFNWLMCGKFAPTTPDIVGEGLGSWFC